MKRQLLTHLGFLVATLVAALPVAAETRFWTLTGVQFSDGAVATGYFSYDDTTHTVANWNVRVSQSLDFFAFTYVPGNSVSFVWDSRTLGLQSDFDGAWWFERHMDIATFAPLDGSKATVPLDASANEGAGAAWGFDRRIIAGALTLTSAPLPAAIVHVDEFYNSALRHYFITADPSEKQDLDSGVHPGWMRTGESFKAYATGSNAGGSINPVCRYYGDPLRGLDSHFYSASASECARVYGAPEWLYESDNLFQVNLPDTATGACPVGTVPVFRLWNQRSDSNHRYTTSVAIKAEMLASGYLAEGYGPGVAMCAVQ